MSMTGRACAHQSSLKTCAPEAASSPASGRWLPWAARSCWSREGLMGALVVGGADGPESALAGAGAMSGA
jgi:hypothetical protein